MVFSSLLYQAQQLFFSSSKLVAFFTDTGYFLRKVNLSSCMVWSLHGTTSVIMWSSTCYDVCSIWATKANLNLFFSSCISIILFHGKLSLYTCVIQDTYLAVLVCSCCAHSFVSSEQRVKCCLYHVQWRVKPHFSSTASRTLVWILLYRLYRLCEYIFYFLSNCRKFKQSAVFIYFWHLIVTLFFIFVFLCFFFFPSELFLVNLLWVKRHGPVFFQVPFAVT